ncbi:hypothetical protein BKA65DRAFT_480115 [Rhexocercosporidium sp. MPI-PUGE-AT-0058]|nr:hypothetical protein BKA65DRAFT_480115 [Rhexocercosporidium sp. MPI-PUGE-AT-0058]
MDPLSPLGTLGVFIWLMIFVFLWSALLSPKRKKYYSFIVFAVILFLLNINTYGIYGWPYKGTDIAGITCVCVSLAINLGSASFCAYWRYFRRVPKLRHLSIFFLASFAFDVAGFGLTLNDIRKNGLVEGNGWFLVLAVVGFISSEYFTYFGAFSKKWKRWWEDKKRKKNEDVEQAVKDRTE